MCRYPTKPMLIARGRLARPLLVLDDAPRRSHVYDVALCAIVAIAYTAAGKFGLTLAVVNASATAVWPPSGIALAALLIFGSRVWPGIFLGAFVVNETTAGLLTTSSIIAAGNTAEALIGAYFVNRFANGRAAFNRASHFLRFMLLAGFVSTSVSATVGAAALTATGLLDGGTVWQVWVTWWLGDATGAIIVAPVLVLWWSNPSVSWTRIQAIEASLVFLGLVTTGVVIFYAVTYPVAFLCVPFCIWAGFRFGRREAATATCLLAVIAVGGTASGLGSFGGQSPNAALLSLQLFLGMTTIAGIVIGIAVDERRQAEDEIRLLNSDLEQRVRARTFGLQRALDDLTATEMRLEEAQEVAHTGSWEWTIADNCLWWSQELRRIYGIDPARYEAFLSAVYPDDRQRVEHITAAAIANRQPFQFEHRIVRTDGEVRTVFCTGRAIEEQGRVVRLIGTAQDITDRKRIEAQLFVAQKREALGRLVSGVSHDFNNLLTAIGGYADLLLACNRLEVDLRTDVLEIKKASERATALTKQLLSFSQPHMIEPSLIDVNTVIEAVGYLVRRLIGDHIVVKMALAETLRGVRADASHIEQILVNLAVNARDAMPRGGHLTIETRNVVIDGQYGFSKPAHPPAGDYVLLAVSDTGCGMDDLVKSHIFEPFFTTKPSGQGTGLGLTTVYDIVKRSGGYVWVYS